MKFVGIMINRSLNGFSVSTMNRLWRPRTRTMSNDHGSLSPVSTIYPLWGSTIHPSLPRSASTISPLSRSLSFCASSISVRGGALAHSPRICLHKRTPNEISSVHPNGHPTTSRTMTPCSIHWTLMTPIPRIPWSIHQILMMLMMPTMIPRMIPMIPRTQNPMIGRSEPTTECSQHPTASNRDCSRCDHVRHSRTTKLSARCPLVYPWELSKVPPSALPSDDTMVPPLDAPRVRTMAFLLDLRSDSPWDGPRGFRSGIPWDIPKGIPWAFPRAFPLAFLMAFPWAFRMDLQLGPPWGLRSDPLSGLPSVARSDLFGGITKKLMMDGHGSPQSIPSVAVKGSSVGSGDGSDVG